MDDIFINISKYFGLGIVSATVLGAVWKFFLQSSIDKIISYKLKKGEQQQKADLDKHLKLFELQTKSIFDAQDKFLSKRLELESVKLNRVFPYLEEINLIISNHRMMYNTYLLSVINDGGLRENFEESRLKIDDEIIEKIYKVGIYLPTELRAVLNQIRKIISCSWKDPHIIFRLIREYQIDKKEIPKKISDILNCYHDCYLEMISQYCSISNEEINYRDLLIKYGLDERANYNSGDILLRFVKAYILYHEYTDSNEYDEITKILDGEND